MINPKRQSILHYLASRGYSEQNKDKELFLMQELLVNELTEFKEICEVLGMAGGLFCVPTLMAFSVEKDSPKQMPAILALTGIYDRVQKTEQSQLSDFFNTWWWRPRWLGTKSKLISYVACVNALLHPTAIFDGEKMDGIGEKLIKEFNYDIFPYNTFNELRLSTPYWDADRDVRKISAEVSGDVLLQAIFAEGLVSSNPATLYEENILNMRCDYLLTRLNLPIPYDPFRYLLKTAEILNSPE